MRSGAVARAACACLLLASCGRGTETTPTLAAQPPAAGQAQDSGALVPHGDHNPHHGGLVLMSGDLHFEVVLGRDGSERVYFSDAIRNELPAATASEVAITVTQKSGPPQTTALRIDESGESWIGRGSAVADPTATARIAFKTQGKPYFIDVPFPR
jgi:hypothetical protein